MGNPGAEKQRLLAIKAALATTVNSAGWQFVKQITENIVDHAIQDALAEDDAVRGEALRKKAKYAQVLFRELFAVIENSRTFGTENESEWFTELSTDFEGAQSER